MQKTAIIKVDAVYSAKKSIQLSFCCLALAVYLGFEKALIAENRDNIRSYLTTKENLIGFFKVF